MTESQFLLLPDGRVLAHNLTPALAAVLAELNPHDAQLVARVETAEVPSLSPTLDSAAMTPLKTEY